MRLSSTFRILVVLIAVGVSLAAEAANTKIQMRSEEGRWIVEKIGIAADGWPEVLNRASYPDQPSASAQMQLLQSQNPSFQTTDLSVQPLMASGVLWKTTNQWNQAWEEKFGKWIEDEVDADFYMRNKIRTDCADVAYSLRWIFSRMHGLPAGADLGGSSMFMTNETLRSEWAKLPTDPDWMKDRRFLKALDYLLDATYTHTLWDDSFPVALNRRALLSGGYHLNLRDDSGHTQVVRWFPEGSGVPFITLNSTVPRQVRPLMESLLSANFPEKGKSALLRFRWAVKGSSGIKLVRSSEMPGYSLEQFSFKSQKEFPVALFEKMGYKADPEAITDYLYKDIFEQLQARVGIVKEGVEKCKIMSCKPGTQGYEDWGTPSRDVRVLGKIKTLDSLASRAIGKPSPWMDKEVLEVEGTKWPLKAMIWNWRYSQFSSNPMDSEAVRWGAGLKSWVKKHEDFYSQKLAERDAHLKKSRELCLKQDCSLTSPAWATLSASAIDSTLRERSIYVSGGRDYFPPELNQELSLAKDHVLYSINGKELTLNYLLRNQVGMNASPLATMEQQWGFDSRAVSLSLFDRPYFGYILTPLGKLMNPDSGEALPILGTIKAALSDKPVLLLQNESTYSLYNFVTGETAVTDIKPGDYSFMNGKNFFVHRQGHVSIFWEVKEAPLRLEEKYRFADTFGPENIAAGEVYLSDNGTLVDVKNDKVYSLQVLEKMARVSDDFILLVDFTKKYRALNRHSGVFTSLADVKGEFTGTSKDLRVIVTMQERSSFIYLYDEQMKIRSIKFYDAFCFPADDGLRISCFYPATSVQKIYEWQGSEFKEIDFGADIVWIGNHYFVKSDGNQRVIYDRKTMRPLMRAGRIQGLSDHLMMVYASPDDRGCLVDMRDTKIPLLTNVFKTSYGWHFTPLSEKDKMNFILTNWEEGSVWSRGK